MSELSKVEREKEKEFITGNHIPLYPVLPVVNKKEQRVGVILAWDNKRLPLKVYMVNTFQLKDDGVVTTK